jgi:hypothetical protein
MVTYGVTRIISGGQTGVDRGALDAAISLGLEHGGWCPRGRLSESGPIPRKYRLDETPSREYWVRTERNVTDSDGTLILYVRRLTGGTEFTYRMTRKHRKPFHLIDLDVDADLNSVRRWIQEHAISTLNVAGPRASSHPGIQEQANRLVRSIFEPTQVEAER